MAKQAKARKPRKDYATAEALQKVVDQYFQDCAEKGDVPSEAGLALAAGITVKTLRRWFDGETSLHLRDVAEDAYSQMTREYLQLLLTGNKNMTPFVIFMLKQPRFAGYQDKVEAKQDISVNVKMGKNVDASDFE